MAGYDAASKYANIAGWMQRVKSYFNPYYDEGHVIVNKLIEKQNKTAAKL